MDEKSSIFQAHDGFCSDCGSILPPLQSGIKISCYTCPSVYNVQAFKNVVTKYTITFNSIYESKELNSDDTEEEGPIVERKCPRCNNDKMSYATLQLRSADEGQTVFYTCTNCKFKETENS